MQRNADIEIAIHDIAEVPEFGWVDEERRHKIYLPQQIGMSCKLVLPSIGGTALAKRTGLSGKGGDKSARIIQQLVGMRGVRDHEVTKSLSITG